MRVLYISPSYFEDASFIGGGERYAEELATAMSGYVDTTLVSFAARRRYLQHNNLKIRLYPVRHFIHGSRINPLSFQYLLAMSKATVVHVHQINTLVADMACLLACLLGKQVFATDHGGGGSLVLNHKLPVFACYRQVIAQSRFCVNFLPASLRNKTAVIKGGIDTGRFCPGSALAREKKILYVGRIVPHKGINYLIEAVRILAKADYRLTIVGRIYNYKFYQYLQMLARGLPVDFIHDADDARVLHEYRTSRVSVLPSVHTDYYGEYTPAPELMGFTLLEAQACGTPVICTDAGAMSEFVDPGNSGEIVAQNSAPALAQALAKMIDLPAAEYAQYCQRCRDWVQPWDWNSVVKKHLHLYKLAEVAHGS